MKGRKKKRKSKTFHLIDMMTNFGGRIKIYIFNVNQKMVVEKEKKK